MKVLMVGLGSIGQRHVRNLRRLLGDRVEILAYRTRRLSHVLSDQLTIQPGIDLESHYDIRGFGDLYEALAQQPEAVFVTNPNSLHMPVALAAAEAGCNLFIEKPLSHSLDDVDRLVELVDQQQLVALIGYHLRYHPCLRLVKELLQAEAVGSLLTVRLEYGEFLPGFHTYEDYRQTYPAHREMGGGVILSQIHELDVAYWLFGMPRKVFALGGHWSSLEIDVEDTASLLLECEYAGRPLPVHIQLDFVQRPPTRTYEIIGDRGTILVDLLSSVVRVLRSETGQVDVRTFEDLQRNQLFLDELRHFLDCLAGQQRPMVSVRDGAQSLRIALAARQSIDAGTVVSL
jgi:predicted dehydrogenase